MINSGFKIIGTRDDDHAPKQFIVIGVSRGGTSAIAASLLAAGIDLGEPNRDYAPNNFEHIALANAFRQRKWKLFKKLVSENEERYENFAWKLPDIGWYINKVRNTFSNPYFIFVYRDLFAIANRRSVTLELDSFFSMEASLKEYQRMIKFAKKKDIRSFHVSYEKMLLEPESYAEALCEFCSLKSDAAKIKGIASIIKPAPDDYIQWASNSKFKKNGLYDGHIDEFSCQKVRGWMLLKDAHKPIDIEVFINQKLMGVFSCNQFREDLISAKKSQDGLAGFDIDLSSLLLSSKIKRDAVVTIKPKNFEHGLSRTLDAQCD